MKLLNCFLRNETFGSIVLIATATFAMVLANLGMTRNFYQAFINTSVELRIGTLDINKNILLWINDALMAVFFLLIGLELKRELTQGLLSISKQAVLPFIGALGGMVTPAIIYLIFNHQDPVARSGWAIPTATDITFSLGLLNLLRNYVPVELKIFLMALAIIDDLGAIIIALFYTNNLSISPIIVATGAVAVLAQLNICNVRRVGIYILVGIILWIAILKSGIHATLAGVIVGFFIPLKEQFGVSPARQLEHILHPWVTFLILPLFVFANAGVSLHNMTLSGLIPTIPLGIIAGLFIGKPLGISSFCWLALKLRIASLPSEITFRQIMAVGVLCGIGFTMSIFITSLAFDTTDPQLIVWAKFGILIGSSLAAFVGYTLLKIKLQERMQIG